jgi:hypothetical protein
MHDAIGILENRRVSIDCRGEDFTRWWWQHSELPGCSMVLKSHLRDLSLVPLKRAPACASLRPTSAWHRPFISQARSLARLAAPYFKRAIDANDHAFDRERDEPVPASWLKSHGRSLVRYHLHPETKFWGGEYDQRGPLRHRRVFALTHVPIGKEADQIEESEYIGEEAGPLEHPIVTKDRCELVGFIVSSTGHKPPSSDGKRL